MNIVYFIYIAGKHSFLLENIDSLALSTLRHRDMQSTKTAIHSAQSIGFCRIYSLFTIMRHFETVWDGLRHFGTLRTSQKCDIVIMTCFRQVRKK